MRTTIKKESLWELPSGKKYEAPSIHASVNTKNLFIGVRARHFFVCEYGLGMVSLVMHGGIWELVIYLPFAFPSITLFRDAMSLVHNRPRTP